MVHAQMTTGHLTTGQCFLGDFRKTGAALATLLLFFALSVTTALAQDPPGRVLRLNHIDGSVSMEPAGVDDWAPAVVNRPFYTGDYLYSDNNSQAELHTDIAAIRIGIYSNLGILNLTDTAIQLKLTQGDVEVTLHDFDQNQTFEVDTPNAAISFLRTGVYRVHVDVNLNTTWAVVRGGQAEVTGGGQAFTLNPGSRATMSGVDNQMSYDIDAQPAPDPWDDWYTSRDAHFSRAAHVPATVIGYEDLDDNGGWEGTPDYGQVWYPRAVAVGWAPYHAGHWAWVEPWGWSWVDDAPWGFAPFHYGRWVYFHSRWGWAPGPMVVAVGYNGPRVRPCYAPAMVAWFGGAHFGVSVSIGGGAPSVGWVPLGWGEVYTPSYHVSQRYFSNVNVYNTTVVKNVNITNVYNTVYVNKTVYNQTFVNSRAPNAVMAMPQNALAGGRPVASAGAALNTTQMAHFQPAQATVTAPPVAPTKQALMPTLNASARAVPHPSAQSMARPIVAKAAPPPPPATFAARQSYLQQHAGQPLYTAEMRTAVKPAPQAQQVALVKQAPPAKAVVVKPGQHLGLAKSQVNVANNKGAPQQPAKPGTPAAPVEPTAKVKPGQEAKPAAEPANPKPKAGEPAAKTNVPAKPLPAAPKPEAPKPAVERPAAPKPEASKPAVERPAAPKPEAPKPAVERPAAPKPEASKPTVERPAAPRPAAPAPKPEKPVAPKPAAERPVAPKPAVERPAAPKPAAEAPAAHGQPPAHRPAEPAAKPPAAPKSAPPPAHKPPEHKTSTKPEK
jgi:hypothetical protein